MCHKLLIWGTSGHALVVANIAQLNNFQIVGFLDDFISTSERKEIYGFPLLGGEGDLRAINDSGINRLVLGFGHCNARLRLSHVAREAGFELIAAIHPTAIIASDSSVGLGSVVVAGAVINPGVKIGENTIINTCASVDHECVIEDGAHIGPGARLGGRVIVGRAAWVGIGAIVKDRVTIGANSIIGAGSVVLEDVPEDTVVYGVPARVIRPIKDNEN